MPYKNIKDRKKYAREYTMRLRRKNGIKERSLMPLKQRREHQRIASKKYYYSHLKQSKERIKLWRKRNPDKQRFIEKRRRARLMNAKGFHTFLQWEQLKKQYGDLCVFCQKKKKLVQDHIIPLNKGGSDFISNIQPLCFSCNSSKQDKIIDSYETELLRFE